MLRMHLLDNLRQRIEAGHDDFVNELRVCTIVFCGFPSLQVTCSPCTLMNLCAVPVVSNWRRTLGNFCGKTCNAAGASQAEDTPQRSSRRDDMIAAVRCRKKGQTAAMAWRACRRQSTLCSGGCRPPAAPFSRCEPTRVGVQPPGLITSRNRDVVLARKASLYSSAAALFLEAHNMHGIRCISTCRHKQST